MASLAVDKIKKKVAVSLADHSQLMGHIFLSEFSELGVGSQTILDTLTGSEKFFPFETADGEFCFINRNQVGVKWTFSFQK